MEIKEIFIIIEKSFDTSDLWTHFDPNFMLILKSIQSKSFADL